METGLDIVQLRKFVQAACLHYEHSAPALSDYLDDLYIRLDETPGAVSVSEVMQVTRLYEETWEHPNYAQNRIYKMLDSVGDTSKMLVSY